jgi:VIT1/CCC1 family predicted Fe2+/Mn2+ transporter
MNSINDHSPHAIKERLKNPPNITYLREWVYGGIDGVVTTFAVVAGVAGANLSPVFILIIALAGLFGDGFSMAAGCYSSTKTEEDNYKRLHKIEHDSIKTNPQGEKEEIRQIYKAKGFKGEKLEHIIDIITEHKNIWIDTMMIEEYGLTKAHHQAWPAALHTLTAFLLCGFMPVLPYIGNFPNALILSTALAGVTFFSIGALKSFWSPKTWWWHGIETFIIGSIAASIAYGTGYGLKLLLL